MSEPHEPPPGPAESRAIELLKLVGSETPAVSSRFTADLVARARAQRRRGAAARARRARRALTSAVAGAVRHAHGAPS